MQNFKLDGGGAGAQDAELFRGGAAEVDDAAGGEGAAVVDADDDGAAAAEVGDADDGAERKGLVGGGQLGFVEGFAGGGFVAVEDGAVPGGDAAKRVAEGSQGLAEGCKWFAESGKRFAEGGDGPAEGSKRGLHGADGVEAAELGSELVQVQRFDEAVVLPVRGDGRQGLHGGGHVRKRDGWSGERDCRSFVVVHHFDRQCGGGGGAAGKQCGSQGAATGEHAEAGAEVERGAVKEARDSGATPRCRFLRKHRVRCVGAKSALTPVEVTIFWQGCCHGTHLSRKERGGGGARCVFAGGMGGRGVEARRGQGAGCYRVFSSPNANQNGTCRTKATKGSCARTRFYVAVVTGTLLL